MGRIRTLLVALLALTPSATKASDIEGLWRTAERNGMVEIKPCGDRVCGYLIDHDRIRLDPGAMDVSNPKPAMRSRPMMDLLLLDHFQGGPKDWDDGAIYNPDNGKSYRGSLKLIDPSHVKVTGCLVRPLCGSQIWVRAR